MGNTISTVLSQFSHYSIHRKNKSSEGFFQWKYSVKVSFPCWQTAHHWAVTRFSCWTKIKTKTNILHSKEQKLILALHEFWSQPNNFVCSSESWQACLTVLSYNRCSVQLPVISKLKHSAIIWTLQIGTLIFVFSVVLGFKSNIHCK